MGDTKFVVHKQVFELRMQVAYEKAFIFVKENVFELQISSKAIHTDI